MGAECNSPYHCLAGMDPVRRSRFLYIDENLAMPARQKRLVTAAFGGDGSLEARARRVEVEPRSITVDQLAGELAEEEERVMAGSDRGGRPAELLAVGDCSAEMALLRSEEGQVWIPVLPWDDRRRAGVSARPGKVTVTASERTIGYTVDGTRSVFAKLELPPGLRPPTRPLSAACMAGRRWAMHRLFGVARDYDGGRLARVDVLHSLYLSARLRQPAEAVGAAILEEVVGLTDQAGGGALARRVTPEPADPDRPLLVPLVSLVGAIGRPRPKLLGLVATATGCQPGDVAFEIGIKHLTAWSDLWLGYGTMVTMPHAQNAHIELRPTNTFGRVVFHDMRDVDVWDRYASASSRDTRLMAVDRHYLRFEMTAHPVYHDARAWRDPRVRLAASLFSFSFQMLWHYVLFPLVVGVAASEQAAARRLESAFTSAVWALGRGQRPPVGMEDCERPTVGRRRAARQLRDLWLAKALAGGGAFEA